MSIGRLILNLKHLPVITKYVLVNLYFRIYIGTHKYKDIKQNISETTGPEAPLYTARWVGRLVFLSAKFVPGTTCLSRAMAAQFALKRKGFSSTMRIGVTKGEQGVLAHAWLVSGECVVVGNEDNELSRYKLLTEMKAPHS